MAHCKAFFTALTNIVVILLMVDTLHAQNIVSAKQGTTMLTQMDNRGTFGYVAYPGAPSSDSIGVKYPATVARMEHVYGAGIWVGGLIDTTTNGTGPKTKAVSTAYEGYGGGAPLFEFFPGLSPADSIWKIYGVLASKPPGWDQYWGSSLPYHPVADQNFYCLYTDYMFRPSGHVLMYLKVIQSSYTWDSPYASGIQIMRYAIINVGSRPIDSVYVGLFSDSDVGPKSIAGFETHNFSGYYPDIKLAYSHNPIDAGSTPFGISVLDAPPANRTTYQSYPLMSSPRPDGPKYDMMSSGAISPDEFPNVSDTRFLFDRGPYRLQPADTLRFAVALLCGPDLNGLRTAAGHALDIYRSTVLSVDPRHNGVPDEFALEQNYPNPFNPATRIKYQIPTSNWVTLRVFDLLGREVATLVNEHMESGTHVAEFDAKELASGVYYYRLQTGSDFKTRKMMLLR